MKKVMLRIEGMTCSACSNGLEKFLNKQQGIENASVNLVMASALVEYDEKIVDMKQIENFVKKAGFKSLGKYNETAEDKKEKSEKILFIIFGILAVILLYVSMGHMLGLPIFDYFNMHINPIGYTVTLFILTIAFIIYGLDLIKNGYKNLIHKTPNMDTLVTIGVLSSFAYSIYSMIMIFKGESHYVEHLYFESAAIVIFFIKLGRYVDHISTGKTKEAIQELVQITPSTAIIKVDGEQKEVTIDEIHIGDIVISSPGSKISVDGQVVKGKAHVDESFITGESKPVTKIVGNKVIAGSVNYDGYLEYTAEKIGKDSTISQIVNLVVEATNTKTPIAKVADKVSGIFVPIVIFLAIVTFLGYLILNLGMDMAIHAFVTILVVACPCALGLATPLAIVVSEGICAKNGILVKKSEILENAAKIDTVVFDKTGTLTYGTLKIDTIYNYSKITEEELLQMVGSIESKSIHPISGAFMECLKDNRLHVLEVSDFEDMSGYGIKGVVNAKEILLGNNKILNRYTITNEHIEDEKRLAQKGNSIIYVVIEKKVVAMIGVRDVIREHAKQIIKKLENRHIETIMLTGDNSETASIIGKEIGISKIISGVLPNQKAEVIQNLKKEGKHVLMCGDGINDSPALANSDIGVSVHSGTDIAMNSSDVILMKNDLNKIIHLIDISKRTIKNVKQNLFWAFLYNVLMIPIAMGLFRGFGIEINPMIAGFAMMISSLTVIGNSLRLKNIKLEK